MVAPPSKVNGNEYQLIEGDFRQLPQLTLNDVLPILKVKTTASERKQSTIPRRAKSLLNGKGIYHYLSRSEAEQAIIAMLINAGLGFEQIHALFQKHGAAGKFKALHREDPKNARRWLRLSYDSAKRWTDTNESQVRQAVHVAKERAEKNPWPGRTGAVNQSIFLAHCKIAYQAGKLKYHASGRALAEMSGVSQPTANRASKRLCRSGYLKIVRESAGDCAHVWKLLLSEDNFITTTQKGVRE